MREIARAVGILSLLGCAVFQAAAADGPAPVDRTEAYFNFAMGHLYAEQAAAFGNRGDYLSRAIEYYKAALKADPNAAIVSEELAGLYLQSNKLRDAVAELEDRLKKDPKAIDARRVLGRLYARLIGDPQTNRVNEEMLRRAVEQYQKITELAPSDVDAWIFLGRLYRVGQSSVESEKAFQRALELDPGNEEALTELALVYANLGDSRRALEVWQDIAKRYPNRRNLTALANTYEELRDFPKAVEVLRQALEQEPDNMEIKRMLAQDLLLAGKLDDALELYQALAADDPRDAQTLLRVSQIYREKRDFQKAREALEKAKNADPDSLEIRYSEVTLLDQEGRRADAITAMRQLVDSTEKRSYSQPEQASRVALLERLALLYRSNEDYPLAVETFRKMAEVDPQAGPRAAAQIIETLRQGRDYARAAEEADAAIRKYPSDRMVVLTRATLLAELGKGTQAVEEARRFFGGKEDKDALLSLAQLYEKTKNWTEMGKTLEAYEKLATGDEDRATLYFMRGAMHERMKDYELAEAEFRKAMAIDADNPALLNYFGYMLADRNVRLEEALKMITRALELEPGNGAYLDSLGWVYYRMDRLDEAETNLRLALQEVPRDATVRDHMGDVLARRGKLKEAVLEWQRAIQEWEAGPPAERDETEIAKIAKKLEGAKVRLAQEAAGTSRKP